MRKVGEKQALYGYIAAAPRVQEARMAHTQRTMEAKDDSPSPKRPRKLPKLPHFPSAKFLSSNAATKRQLNSSSQSVDLRAVEDQVLAVHRSLKSLSHNPPKKYTLLTSDQPLEDRFLIRNRKFELNLDPYAISTAASRSKAGFFDSVSKIKEYRGTPVEKIRSIRHLSEYRPFDHPQAGELLEKIQSGNYLEVQRLILNDKSLLKVQDSIGSSLLHRAVKRRDVRLVSMLLSLGAEVNATDSAGRTPLYLACRKQQIDVVQVLLSHHANPKKATINGQTPDSIVSPSSYIYKLMHPAEKYLGGTGRIALPMALTMKYLKKVKDKVGR